MKVALPSTSGTYFVNGYGSALAASASVTDLAKKSPSLTLVLVVNFIVEATAVAGLPPSFPTFRNLFALL